MRVVFASGHEFDGPWTDDDSIPADVVAYRRLEPQGVLWVDGKPERVKSYAFQPHRDSHSISVTLEDRALELGLDPMLTALPQHLAGQYGLCRFPVGAAQGLGFWIRRIPTDDPAHAMMFVAGPDGVAPHKKRCKTLGKSLTPSAELDIAPPPPPPPLS